MSFRIFEVSFGAQFRNMVRDSFKGSGHGQFRSHAMASFRPRPARTRLKLPTWAPKLTDPRPETDSACAETGRRNYPPLIRNPRQPIRNQDPETMGTRLVIAMTCLHHLQEVVRR